MNRELIEDARLEQPLGRLEHALIDAFIRGRGYDPASLADLPDAERETLLKEASVYASGKLVEIEARSHYFDEIHGKDGPHRSPR